MAVCEKCGQEHDPRKCVGHKSEKRGGGPCPNWPMKGGKVCHAHGGRAKQVRDAAKRRQQEEAAQQAVLKHALPRDVSPHNALLEELCRTAGYIDYLEATVQADPGHEWWDPLQEQRVHYRHVAWACVRAGIEQRRMEITEQLAEQIAAFARGVMEDLGINPNSEKARVAFRKHLTLIVGGKAA